MNAFVVILTTALLIALSGFFVIIEFALLGERRRRLEIEAEASPSARAALRGMNELTLMLAVAQLGITGATFALGAITKPAVDRWLGPALESVGVPSLLAGGASFALSLFLVTFLHLVVGEMAPKSWAIAHPETAAKMIGIPSRILLWLFRPFLVVINGLANRLVRASGVVPVERAAVAGQDVDTIRQLVEHSAAKGTLPQAFQLQISDVLELERLKVGDLVPEDQMTVAVGQGATVQDVQDAAAQSGHKRILLEASAGEPSRIIHVRDTLTHEPGEPASPLARASLVLDADVPVYEALAGMRQNGQQLAVITRGVRVIGVVTLADILHRVLPESAGAL